VWLYCVFRPWLAGMRYLASIVSAVPIATGYLRSTLNGRASVVRGALDRLGRARTRQRFGADIGGGGAGLDERRDGIAEGGRRRGHPRAGGLGVELCEARYL
jgi:hypothetical protein